MTNLPSTTRRGYVFSGWYVDSAITTLFNPEDSRSDWEFTLYAGWTALDPATVTFESRGGSAVESISMYVSEIVTMPNSPIKTGYEFGGWCTDPEGTNLYNVQSALTGNLTLYAKWNPILVQVRVEYYIESLSGDYVFETAETLMRYTDSTAELPGRTFAGFSDNSAHPAQVATGIVAPDGTLVLKAYLSRNDYTISFDANADLSISSITLPYQTNVTKPEDPTRAGFTFLGWFVDEAFTIPYQFTTMPAEHLTLHAQWLGAINRLHYDMHNGSFTGLISAPIESSIQPPTEPTRLGFSFSGWYYDETGTKPFTNWVMPLDEITIHAKWTPLDYVLTFEENGGSMVTDISAPYQSTLSRPENPIKTDYLFVGWFLDPDLVYEFTFSTMPLNGGTVYAKWVSAIEDTTISTIIGFDEGTSVEVTGIVFAELNSGQIGYYVYDSTGYLFIQDNGDNGAGGTIEISKRYRITGILHFWNGVPMVSSVSEITLIDENHPLPNSQSITVSAAADTLPVKTVFSSPATLVGFVEPSESGYVLFDPSNGREIALDPRMGGDLSLWENRYVEIDAIFTRHLGTWQMGVYTISEPVISDSVKAQMLADWIAFYVQGVFYYEETEFAFRSTDPFGWGTFTYQFNETNRVYIDDSIGRFKTVTDPVDVVVPVLVTVGEATSTWNWTFSLHPQPDATIAAYLAATEGEILDLRAVVTMVSSKGFVLLEDTTGVLYFYTEGDYTVGDEVQLTVRRNSTYYFVNLTDTDVMGVETIHRLSWKEHIAHSLSAEEFAILDPYDPATYGQYVEIRGFLDQLPFEQWGSGHGFRLTDDANFDVEIIPITEMGIESLFEHIGLEVLFRGYIGIDASGNIALYYEDLRGDLQLPIYTDQEKVDMIGCLFARENAGREFISFEEFVFWPYHPVLGGTITWEFPEDFDSVYDIEKRIFRFTEEPQNIEIGFTITEGSVSKSFLFQTMLNPPEITTIAELRENDISEGVYVQGLVIYRTPNFFYLQDNTGLIIVNATDVSVYAGDEVVLYARKEVWVSDQPNVYLYYVDMESNFIVVDILSRDNPVVIQKSDKTLSEIVDSNPADEASYNLHVTISGLLKESEEYGVYFEIVRGYDRILIICPDEYTEHKMRTILAGGPVEVDITGYVYGFDQDNGLWYLLWTGLEAMAYPDYSDSEIAEMIADFITNEVAGEITESSTDFLPPLTHPTLGGTIAYETYGDNATLVNLTLGSVAPVTVSTPVSFRATITVGETELVLNLTWTVIPGSGEGEYVIITTLLDQPRYDDVWIEGTIISAYDNLDGTAEILVTDGLGKLWVHLPGYTVLYDGKGIVGLTLTVFGSLSRDHGLLKFYASQYEINTTYNPEGFHPDPMSLAEMDAFDVYSEWWWVGGSMSLEGILGVTADGLYVLRGEGTEIVLKSCYFDINDLTYAIGLPIAIQGYFAGVDITGGVERMALSFTDTDLGNGLPYQVLVSGDQAIAEMMADRLMADIEGRFFQPLEWFPVTVSTPIYPELFVEYFCGEDNGFIFIDDSLHFAFWPEDRECTATMVVYYKSMIATRTLHFTLNGFSEGTIEDLFVLNGDLAEVGFPVIILYQGFGFTYVEYQGSVYYLEGFIEEDGFHQSGDGVYLYGIRTPIDGEPGFTYDLRFYSLHYNSSLLTCTDADVTDVYDVAAGNLSAYLNVRGILGYDDYLDMFTLTSGGRTVYIREFLSEGGEYYGMSYGDYVMRNDLRQLIGDDVQMKVFVSDDTVRGDILVVDFRGLADELAQSELLPEEVILTVADKIFAKVDGMTFHGGQQILSLLPTWDDARMVAIDYSLAEGFEDVPINWDNAGAVGLLSEPMDVQFVCTLTYVVYEGDTPIEYTDFFTFTLHLIPAQEATVREVLWGTLREFYVLEGIVEYHFDNWWIILSDATGTIYIDATGHEDNLGEFLSNGDVIRILGVRDTYEYENNVPVMKWIVDIDVIGHGAVPTHTPKVMTVEDMLALDYLCPDVFNQYVVIRGTVIFSGNYYGYRSYDIREDGMPETEEYDIQIWSDTYDPFNDIMDPLVGTKLQVEGYLIGYLHLYGPFEWFVMHVSHQTMEP